MLKHLGQVNLGGLSFSIIRMGLQQDLTHRVVSELIRLCREGDHGSAQRASQQLLNLCCPHSIIELLRNRWVPGTDNVVTKAQ